MALTTIPELIAALKAGRDSVSGIVTIAVSERDAVKAERDALVLERAPLQAAKDALSVDLDLLRTVRDGLVGELVPLQDALDALQVELAALRADRTVIQDDPVLTEPERETALAANQLLINAKVTEVQDQSALLTAKRDEIQTQMGLIDSKIAEVDAQVALIQAKVSEIAVKKTELDAAIGKIKEARAYNDQIRDELQKLRGIGGVDETDTIARLQDAYDDNIAIMAAPDLWEESVFRANVVVLLQNMAVMPITVAQFQAMLESTVKTVAHAEDNVKESCCDWLAREPFEVVLEERPSEVAAKAAIVELESGSTTFAEMATAIRAIRVTAGNVR